MLATPAYPRPRRHWAFAAALAALLAIASYSRAGRCGQPGEDITVSVLTFGPGDHPFFKFGHNAILVHDAGRHRDDVYNFGTFNFSSMMLIPEFLKGRILYWLSVQSFDGTIAHYREQNRSVVAQELALTPEQRSTLAVRLAQNARPDRRYYKYDYFRDNCSTRVRDAIDSVIGGRIHEATRGPASMSLRAHTERLAADDILFYLGLEVVLGAYVDRPISQWDEMFLPSKLQEYLRRVTIVGPNGDVPLVSAESVLVASTRPPVRATPPQRVAPMVLVGALAGAAVAALGRVGARRRPAQVAFAAVLLAVSLALGCMGCAFVFLWLATDHEATHQNENILQCPPWAIVLSVAAARLVMKRKGNERAVQTAAAIVFASSLIGLALKAVRVFHQDNGQIIALLLPIWLGAAIGSGWPFWPLTLRPSMVDKRSPLAPTP